MCNSVPSSKITLDASQGQGSLLETQEVMNKMPAIYRRIFGFISDDLEQNNKNPPINMGECQGFLILLFIALICLNKNEITHFSE